MRPFSVQVQFSKQQEREILHSKVEAFRIETKPTKINLYFNFDLYSPLNAF